MPLPDSGWIRALVLQLVTYWMCFPPEQQWAKGLLMIRLRDCAVWQLWHENTERASITRMESAKTAICLDRVGSCIKLFYTGWFMQDNMTLLWTVSLQQPSKRDTIPPPPKKKPFKGLHHTWCHTLQLLSTSATTDSAIQSLYSSICSRQQVWSGKRMKCPECCCFHFRWCRTFSSNLPLYLTFQSS